MLKGLTTLLIFQFLGECIADLFKLLIPGAVIGMILLFLFLTFNKKSFDSLDKTSYFFIKYLPLFFIPSAVGMVTQVDTLSKEFSAISISLVLGTILSFIFIAKFMQFLINCFGEDND